MTCPFCTFIVGLNKGESELGVTVERKRVYIAGIATMIAFGTEGLRGICPECELHLTRQLTLFVVAREGGNQETLDALDAAKKANSN